MYIVNALKHIEFSACIKDDIIVVSPHLAGTQKFKKCFCLQFYNFDSLTIWYIMLQKAFYILDFPYNPEKKTAVGDR